MNRLIELKQIERQLILYDVFRYFEEVTFRDIEFVLPGLGKRMIQRDIRDLTNAGLIHVSYDRARQAYVPMEEKKDLSETVVDENCGEEIFQGEMAKKEKHYYRLRRLAFCMKLTYCADPVKEYFKEFPEATERMRLRDFEALRRIGYEAGYSRECEGIIVDNNYANPYDGYDVRRKEGKLVRYR